MRQQDRTNDVRVSSCSLSSTTCNWSSFTKSTQVHRRAGGADEHEPKKWMWCRIEKWRDNAKMRTYCEKGCNRCVCVCLRTTKRTKVLIQNIGFAFSFRLRHHQWFSSWRFAVLIFCYVFSSFLLFRSIPSIRSFCAGSFYAALRGAVVRAILFGISTSYFVHFPPSNRLSSISFDFQYIRRFFRIFRLVRLHFLLYFAFAHFSWVRNHLRHSFGMRQNAIVVDTAFTYLAFDETQRHNIQMSEKV